MQRLTSSIGKEAVHALRLSIRKNQADTIQPFSISMISAMSQDKILATQLIEGGVDATIFENFVFKLLQSVRMDEHYQGRDIIVFMDNARIHKHQMVLETFKAMKVHVLFNCQYSPWINPVEQLFGAIKKKLREKQTLRR